MRLSGGHGESLAASSDGATLAAVGDFHSRAQLLERLHVGLVKPLPDAADGRAVDAGLLRELGDALDPDEAGFQFGQGHSPDSGAYLRNGSSHFGRELVTAAAAAWRMPSKKARVTRSAEGPSPSMNAFANCLARFFDSLNLSARQWAEQKGKGLIDRHLAERAATAKNATNLRTLDDWAKALGAEAWQLIRPGYRIGDVPTTTLTTESQDIVNVLEKLPDVERKRLHAHLIRTIDFGLRRNAETGDARGSAESPEGARPARTKPARAK